MFRLPLLLALAASAAFAHFPFIVPAPGGAKAHLFLSEELTPDRRVAPVFVASAKLSLRSGGADTPLTLVRASDAFELALPGSGARVVHGFLDLGFTNNRPSSKPHLLLYYPKTLLGDPYTAPRLGPQTAVEIVPTGQAGATRLLLLGKGRPLPNADIRVIYPSGEQQTLKTDDAGLTAPLPQSGRFGAWARFWESSPGERDGRKYEELRHYATLVFDAPAPLFARLPQAAASFGAAENDGWLYVYGGHIANTHQYHTGAITGSFHRLRLGSSSPQWEALPGGPALQGMNLVAHHGSVYRIGGMTCVNAPGTPTDNQSTASAARFDLAAQRWIDLPPLPEPRSSHDLAVLGNTLYVIGGWRLGGKEEKWHDTMLALDLSSPQPAWRSLPQPFRRRAFMAAALDGKVYIVGGIDNFAKVQRTVSIYDPASGVWTEAPQLPAGPTTGFSPAVAAHNGALYASVADGSLLRLRPGAASWDKIGTATPRVAHRLAIHASTAYVIGGADKGRNSALIESLPLDR